MNRLFYEPHHESFRGSVREFVRREVVPHLEEWDRMGKISPALWPAAARQGLLGLAVRERYGGGRVPDCRYRCVITEALAIPLSPTVTSAAIIFCEQEIRS
jgi:alkylation response protein AidB-like acyl-CoA dehydrogenase